MPAKDYIVTDDSLISIIMPVFNAEKYLDRSISSVANQLYRNWELLIVDDGSTDNSVSIILSWVRKDSRIRLIQNQHGGTAFARNTALDQARGQYIAFIDADDAYHPSYLSYMLDAIVENHVDIALCATIRGTDANDYLNSVRVAEFFVISQVQAFEQMYGGNWPDLIAPYTKIYKKSIFNDLRFPNGMFFEDAATMHLTIYRVRSIAITKEPLYYYNITPNSSSLTKKSAELLDREKALRSHWKYYEKENRIDLVRLSIPFYLSELIIIHYKITHSDNPAEIEKIKDCFKNAYKKYRHEITFTETQNKQFQSFLHPKMYDIKNMIQDKGFFKTVAGFVKRKTGK